jgi:hypothetical protein
MCTVGVNIETAHAVHLPLRLYSAYDSNDQVLITIIKKTIKEKKKKRKQKEKETSIAT